MDWKNLAGIIGKSAPLLGTLIGGPAAAAVGAIVSSALGVESTPDAVNTALSVDPEAAIKLAQIESEQRVRLQELATDQAKAELVAIAQGVSDVNKTMQVEATTEHWVTYSWRPAIGFAVAIAVVLSIFTVFFSYGAVLFFGRSEGLNNLPGILTAIAGIIGVVLPILGINSWFHGKALADPANTSVTR